MPRGGGVFHLAEEEVGVPPLVDGGRKLSEWVGGALERLKSLHQSGNVDRRRRAPFQCCKSLRDLRVGFRAWFPARCDAECGKAAETLEWFRHKVVEQLQRNQIQTVSIQREER